MPNVNLLHGDVRQALSILEADSVDCVVTSPPYWGLRDYGLEPTVWGGDADCEEWLGTLGLEPTPQLYVQHVVEVFRGVRRTLKPWGTAWLNIGDSYAGSGKGQMGNGQHSVEHGSIQSASRGSLVGGLPTNYSDLKPKDLVGIPWRVAFALQDDGWWLRSDIIWSKPNPMPESVTDRPTKAHEYVFLLAKSPTYYYDQEAVREPLAVPLHAPGNKKFFAFSFRPDLRDGMSKAWGNPAGRNTRSVWHIATQPYHEAHFATYPEKLVEPCIKAGTSERGNCPECGRPWERVVEKGSADHSVASNSKYWHHSQAERLARLRQTARANGGEYVNTSTTTGWKPPCHHDLEPVPAVVLDPFIGSGTTAKVAIRLGRDAIGIDASEEYLQLAKARIGGTQMELIR